MQLRRAPRGLRLKLVRRQGRRARRSEGLAQIDTVHDRKALQAKLTALVAKLRADRPTSESKRRARALAVSGFTAKLTSVRAEREFYENDSGQVAEATIDAARADKFRTHADSLLHDAEQALGDE